MSRFVNEGKLIEIICSLVHSLYYIASLTTGSTYAVQCTYFVYFCSNLTKDLSDYNDIYVWQVILLIVFVNLFCF